MVCGDGKSWPELGSTLILLWLILVEKLVRDRSLITGREGGYINGKIISLKLFAVPPQEVFVRRFKACEVFADDVTDSGNLYGVLLRVLQKCISNRRK